MTADLDRRPFVGGQMIPCDYFIDSPNEASGPDFDQFQAALNRHFYPADVRAVGRARTMEAPRITAVRLSMTTLGYIRLGAEGAVEPGILPAYHVDVTLNGRVVTGCGGQEVVTSPDMAAVSSAGRYGKLPRWGARAAQLSIKLGKPHVEAELGRLIGRRIAGPVVFKFDFPLHAPAGSRWLASLSALLAALPAPSSPAQSRQLELLERNLIVSLLLNQQHSFSDEIRSGALQPVARSGLDRVVTAIEDEPERAYTITDLAALAGVSVRSLQYAFQERFGQTPMSYLRGVRLDRAHLDLSADNGTVSDIAHYWGFTNLGRFARAYQDRFGELPAHTRESSREFYAGTHA